jgi:hypothetical protein
MTLRIILKNGADFTVKAADLEYAWNNITGELTRLNFKGVTENKPVHLALDQVAAIVRGLSDEIEEAEAETKPKTNRDTLRTMTSEELAKLFSSCESCAYNYGSCKGLSDCANGRCEWLEKEVKENG